MYPPVGSCKRSDIAGYRGHDWAAISEVVIVVLLGASLLRVEESVPLALLACLQCFTTLSAEKSRSCGVAGQAGDLRILRTRGHLGRENRYLG